MGAIIAIDLGLKRIGLALSYGNTLVTPLPAIERKNRNQAANDVKKVLNEYEATTVVVGIPMGSTTEDEMRRRVAHFMNLVEFNGEIAYQDESHSSKEAEELMKGDIRYKRDGRIDSLSAKIILERYLKII
ncbi:Holliday junction resolvase YqgF [Sulfuricurvum kujiense DSM 16994]|uniref:Putative pre-16S rRNA nuclease n=1 Tax=Sulfuricurvum kujiense (strain ATCC BAA-921 / DSM 16994 / JCM 11577 / YK-1) TaxID=709032 RepID=E4U0F0_SULKY|nr:Holliday junction resolvase RuvX [Sulfuricurvum kujiense]ADR33247.1 Holliday junction resolvase YqgF [Sulfuricurvum kujiense DSM 16994]